MKARSWASPQLLVPSHLGEGGSAGPVTARGGCARTHLAPQQFSNTDEETPEPLGQGEVRTAEGFPPKFHNDNLGQRERQPIIGR